MKQSKKEKLPKRFHQALNLLTSNPEFTDVKVSIRDVVVYKVVHTCVTMGSKSLFQYRYMRTFTHPIFISVDYKGITFYLCTHPDYPTKYTLMHHSGSCVSLGEKDPTEAVRNAFNTFERNKEVIHKAMDKNTNTLSVIQHEEQFITGVYLWAV